MDVSCSQAYVVLTLVPHEIWWLVDWPGESTNLTLTVLDRTEFWFENSYIMEAYFGAFTYSNEVWCDHGSAPACYIARTWRLPWSHQLGCTDIVYLNESVLMSGKQSASGSIKADWAYVWTIWRSLDHLLSATASCSQNVSHINFLFRGDGKQIISRIRIVLWTPIHQLDW